METSVFARSEEFLRKLAEENPHGSHGRAAEILKQLGKRSPDELKRLQARMPFIQMILSVREVRKTAEEMMAFLTDFGALPKPSSIKSLNGDWLSKMVKAEINAWQQFAGWKIGSEKFAETLKALGKDRLEIFIGYGFEPGMLPNIVLTEEMVIPRWVKPGPWVWEQLNAGNLYRMVNDQLFKNSEAWLSGHPVLFDRRCKPAFNNGRQRWEDDRLLECLIEKLQQEDQLPIFDWCDRGSRFGLSRFDWAKVAVRLDEALEFSPAIFRLESWEEWSVLSQYKSGLPRSKDGQTNTWLWFDEYFLAESDSLYGGDSGNGGFASVSCNSSDSRWSDRSARLLGDLGSLVS